MERREFLRKSIQTTLAVGGAAALSSQDALLAHAASEDPGSGQVSYNVLQAAVNEGDWVEGAPQWWWKYVFPARLKFWSRMLAERVATAGDPSPDPWKEQVIGGLLEAAVMLSAVPGADASVATKLKGEAKTKIALATRAI
jgi:hypothetical protein